MMLRKYPLSGYVLEKIKTNNSLSFKGDLEKETIPFFVKTSFFVYTHV